MKGEDILERKVKKCSKRKYQWKWNDVINPFLSEKEISDEFNRKIAHIIVEKEHNPVSYVQQKTLSDNRCKNQ